MSERERRERERERELEREREEEREKQRESERARETRGRERERERELMSHGNCTTSCAAIPWRLVCICNLKTTSQVCRTCRRHGDRGAAIL